MSAQPLCMTLEALESMLATDHGERHVGSGKDFGDRDMRFYVSDTGTWTVVGIHPSGLACVMAVGEVLPLPGTPS